MFRSLILSLFLAASLVVGQDTTLFAPPDTTSSSVAPTSTPTSTPASTPTSTPTSTPASTPASTPTPSASTTPMTTPTTASMTTSSTPISHPVSASGETTSATKRLGPILGGIIGALLAVAIALGSIFTLKNLSWLSSSLACALGVFAFKGRRLIIRIDPEVIRSIAASERQIGLFITKTPELSVFNKSNIVWKVLFYKDSEREYKFTIDIPCWRKGKCKNTTFGCHGVTQLGYGSITDIGGTSVEVTSSGYAPVTLVEDGVWRSKRDPSAQEKNDDTRTLYNHDDIKVTKLDELTATNSSGQSANIVVGTINEGDNSPVKIQPFLLIEDFEKGSTFALETSDLYIHAFKVRNDQREGRYGHTVGERIGNTLTATAIEEDRMTPKHGICINKLAPLTSWSVLSENGGGLRIVPAKNQKGDLVHCKNERKLGNGNTSSANCSV